MVKMTLIVAIQNVKEWFPVIGNPYKQFLGFNLAEIDPRITKKELFLQKISFGLGNHYNGFLGSKLAGIDPWTPGIG